MFWKTTTICLLFFLFVEEVYNRPALKTGLTECYKQRCPENTVACQKKSEVTEDRSSILTEISCLDLHDKVLRTVNLTESNPFGKNTYFQGYSFSGTYDFTDDDLTSTSQEQVPNEETKKEVERKGSPKTEVEDLNS